MPRYLSVALVSSLGWVLLTFFGPLAGAPGPPPPYRPPPSASAIHMTLEEPAAGSTYSGVANVRGWAVAPQGVEKVELYVDSQFFSNLPLVSDVFIKKMRKYNEFIDSQKIRSIFRQC